MKKQGFTLAEVLITLAIIGVVAAISIPSVVANTQQKEFQTGLRKAVSVLNSAITMNMAIDGESPYENKELYEYLGRHMSIIRTNVTSPAAKNVYRSNVSFYTTDGMRFEFPYYSDFSGGNISLKLYEDNSIKLIPPLGYWYAKDGKVFPSGLCNKKDFICSYCGSYGLNSNTDNTTNPPCLVVVDVNGDRKPFPSNASCVGYDDNNSYSMPCSNDNKRSYGDPSGTKLSDTFAIMITDKQAIPYGVVAQRAMYQAQKSK